MELGLGGVWLLQDETLARSRSGLALPAAVRKRRAFRRVERRRQGDKDEDILGGHLASVEFPLLLRCFVTVMEALRWFDRFGWWGRRWRQQVWQLAGVGLGVAVCLRMPLLRWLAVEAIDLAVEDSLLWLNLGVLLYGNLARIAELELGKRYLYWKVEAVSSVLDLRHKELVD
jgi:hypothetical protein